MKTLKPLDVTALAVVWAGVSFVTYVSSWTLGKLDLVLVIVASTIAAYYLSKWIILKKGD